MNEFNIFTNTNSGSKEVITRDSVKDEKSFETYMYEILKSKNFIEHVMIGDVLDPVTKDVIDTLISKPTKIEVDSQGLIFKNDDGELIRCPNYGLNISADGKWLSDKIPDIGFDIEQNGNLRKAEEAQSAFCCAIVYLVVQDDSYKDNLLSVLNNYDYETMTPRENGKSFVQLLEEWQNYQSTTINIAVSAAKIKISDLKKDSEKFLKDGIPEKETAELRDLSDQISTINREYSIGPLSPTRVQNLTKIEILQKLEERNSRVNQLKKESPVGTLWSLCNLSSEYVSSVVKNRVTTLAQTEVEKLFSNNKDLEIIIGEPKIIQDRWRRRYIKAARLSVRKTEIEKYLSDPENYIFPVKL